MRALFSWPYLGFCEFQPRFFFKVILFCLRFYFNVKSFDKAGIFKCFEALPVKALDISKHTSVFLLLCEQQFFLIFYFILLLITYTIINNSLLNKLKKVYPEGEHTQNMKNKQKKQKKLSFIPSQIAFEPPTFSFFSKQNYSSNQAQIKNNVEFQFQTENAFSVEDRESLKNAFRYICRLIFKQAIKYKQKIKQIAERYDFCIQNDAQLLQLFQKAQQISGQRYFRKYINPLSTVKQKTICEYMHWFLTRKYLRYISLEGKGKRKHMKKGLYIKFKNQVMLPYIQSFL